MYYLVALGNPGKEYRETRHNIGQLVMDKVRAELGMTNFFSSRTYHGQIATGVCGWEEVQLFFPDTFMNESGGAVAKFVPKRDFSKLIVIADEVDLPLGQLKVSVARGDGGHNGIASIIRSLGSNEFVRIRLGIAGSHPETGAAVRPDGARLAKFVLGTFTAKEMKVVESLTERVAAVIITICTEGASAAMNKFNVKG